LLIWVLGITFAAHFIRGETDTALFDLAEPLQNLGVIACLAWFLVSFIQNAESRYIEYKRDLGKEVDHTVV